MGLATIGAEVLRPPNAKDSPAVDVDVLLFPAKSESMNNNEWHASMVSPMCLMRFMPMVEVSNLEHILLCAFAQRGTYLNIIMACKIFMKTLAAIVLSPPGFSGSSSARLFSSMDGVDARFSFALGMLANWRLRSKPCSMKPSMSYLMPGTVPRPPFQSCRLRGSLPAPRSPNNSPPWEIVDRGCDESIET